MSNAAEYFKNTPGVHLEKPEMVEGHRFEPELGYFVEEQSNNCLSIVGVSVPFPERPEHFPATIRPRIGYNTLPHDNGSNERIFGKINRGIGPRVRNTVEALGDTRENYTQAGIYTFSIASPELLDMRTMTDGRILTLAEQAGKLAVFKLLGGKKMTDLVHGIYGNAKAVLFDQTPDGRRQQRLRNVESPDGVDPQMIIIRSADTAMHRVGRYQAPGTKSDHIDRLGAIARV
jgi:hypothetical protein